MTPYRRSKPVAIASDVNAVDITASASTPGAKTSIGGVLEVEADPLGAGDAADQHDHRDHHGEQQLLAVAEHQLRLHRGLREHLAVQRRGARASG